ncbi:MAG: aspartate carbamoyltransferase catalytic subunit [Nitrospira sp.]|jgi:aspartate carbamoyltransferase catalytic subunit|uniref:Aspartate carbamoyltransferase n=1 Tax=Candidatus Nitrospira inopinata TaxID=1715989 RepID=A0A0S4KWV7_9BACT|nr:aspartate carbamoyltransferase catalytic subunit [Candidatus Nitrospira inopinata]MCP9450598.1 aspartate carbamoyltransferase catalytic subunit [Nitrospira sp.]MCP9463053.1 aspartate carbamoyltransferase catalytic subunit [Nitrospira sp.]MCP9469478.1 aspartate carbamoyltransferase catalytic subunit [Nitrospira sp.]MCP9475391.1 aspartate carbamoyltransferase catalytic subunit [Nitrospira sp.]CUQ67856.1 Aspartate carbamoyltransferase [Candidatus Nitrospira inopinata]
MGLKRKDLLGLASLSTDEIRLILDTADSFKEVTGREIKKVPALRGKTVVNLFFEPSTRTRTSFELAAKRLSADVINFSPSTSSVVKGETLLDTARNIEAMQADIIVLRHSSAGAADTLARGVKSSVINAGDGWHEHPTQALLDLYTIRQRGLEFKGLRVAVVGDVAHSRVARSNLYALTKLGAEVRLVGPATMMPSGVERLGATVYHDMDEGLRGVHVIMMLRLQLERQGRALFPTIREYARLYGLTAERVELADPGAIVMHPGPINRGVEIAPDVADSLSSVILDQVANGVAVRMGVLYLMSEAG